ncbi:MAG: reverse transcriptase-like protein [Candidatus Binatia bacterium]
MSLRERLHPFFDRAVALLRDFEAYRIVHVPREANQLADRLANKGIEDAIKKPLLG